ncbi:MAG: HU family DNA-binding protein [Alphaproteobacteria bacterium]|nr:HU family DNA-binding protein [Alphaproteobacteria bacterium]
MIWTELIARLVERSGRSEDEVRSVLNALVDETTEALLADESVPLRNLGTFSARWRQPRTVRSISDGRKIVLDGRHVPHFRASGALRQRLTERTPQTWRDPAQQEAWRVAETLVDDLDLYHSAMAPRGLSSDDEVDTVLAACDQAFGTLWRHVVDAYRGEVDPTMKGDFSPLAAAATSRWADSA